MPAVSAVMSAVLGPASKNASSPNVTPMLSEPSRLRGQLLAMLVLVVLQQLLSPDEMRAWGWRIPFALGAAGGLVVLVLRRTMQETATRSSMARKEAGSLAALWRNHKRAAIVITLFTCGGSLYFYTFLTYAQKLLVCEVVTSAGNW